MKIERITPEQAAKLGLTGLISLQPDEACLKITRATGKVEYGHALPGDAIPLNAGDRVELVVLVRDDTTY